MNRLPECPKPVIAAVFFATDLAGAISGETVLIDGMNTLMGAAFAYLRTLAVRDRVLEEDDTREGAETFVELMACLPKI